jgi:cell division transport system ATP-binding protein
LSEETRLLVEIKSVSRFYPTSHRIGAAALAEVSLTVQKGEAVVVAGPGGAGKTTLLSLIWGEEAADEGAVWVDGHNIAHLSGGARAALRRKMGMIFQDLKLPPHRTVLHQVSLPLEVAGWSSVDVRRRTREILQRVGLSRQADRLIASLSTGEQQRVAFARALVHHPRLILADEPTAHLDETLADEMISLLRESQTNGATVWVATRQSAPFSKMPGQGVFMQQGRCLPDVRCR